MKMLRLTILFIFFNSANAATFETGNAIYSGLEDWKRDSSINSIRASTSFGYVIGVHDALQDALICSPPNITKGQIVDVVFNYLKENPQTRHLSAEVLINQALIRFYPCKKK
jgi:hypothetical protein